MLMGDLDYMKTGSHACTRIPNHMQLPGQLIDSMP